MPEIPNEIWAGPSERWYRNNVEGDKTKLFILYDEHLQLLEALRRKKPEPSLLEVAAMVYIDDVCGALEEAKALIAELKQETGE